MKMRIQKYFFILYFSLLIWPTNSFQIGSNSQKWLASKQITSSRGNKAMQMSDQQDQYKSKCTSAPDLESKYYEGMEERKNKLHAVLTEIGIDPVSLTESARYKGSAALRAYSSFILPKSEGALAMANQAQRAAVIANNISFLLKEQQSHEKTWLRNHDKALEEIKDVDFHPITIILDNVRSAANVGNILRSAEAAKVKQCILGGTMTPSPPNKQLLKTAMGAAEYVQYKTVRSTLEAIKELKENNVKVIGVETTSKSVSLWTSDFFPVEKEGVAFVFGNEIIGVDTTCLEECDEIIMLPTHGVKNSLNVSNCCSIVIWEALRQLEEKKRDP